MEGGKQLRTPAPLKVGSHASKMMGKGLARSREVKLAALVEIKQIRVLQSPEPHKTIIGVLHSIHYPAKGQSI